MFGLGTVGSQIADSLLTSQSRFARELGFSLRLKTIVIRDKDRDRPDVGPEVLVTDDPASILEDPEIKIVIEVMGGEHPAVEYIERAIAAGKGVVTANKEVIAKHGRSLIASATAGGTGLRFEAAVGGGTPIVGPLVTELAANQISVVRAIINGTTNYMLSLMAQHGESYENALAQAQELGYAEAQPSSDVEGTDAAYKLAILCSLAFGTEIKHDDVFCEGITRLRQVDFVYARELGYAIKLIAVGRIEHGRVQARVHPAFLPSSSQLAGVDGVLNAVELSGDLIGSMIIQGPGAGGAPTASAVLADLFQIGRFITSGANPSMGTDFIRELPVEPIDQLVTRYYVRLRVSDQPGVMARITTVLGVHRVSLASVIQKEVLQSGELAEIVIVTHEATEASVQAALVELDRLEAVYEIAALVRIEEPTA